MWPEPREIADLVTFTEEIFNGKHHFHAVIDHAENTIFENLGLKNYNGKVAYPAEGKYELTTPKN